ncbi:hypothetical protein CHS0354_027979, partial [Potamilus streckersoni]
MEEEENPQTEKVRIQIDDPNPDPALSEAVDQIKKRASVGEIHKPDKAHHTTS